MGLPAASCLLLLLASASAAVADDWGSYSSSGSEYNSKRLVGAAQLEPPSLVAVDTASLINAVVGAPRDL
jgi:hypothetical protein